MHTIVDGYNLIFECGLEGRSRTAIALQRARDRLIASLAARLSDQQRKGITIVFDAKRLPIKEVSSVAKRNEMTIIYAVDHDDADSLIEQLILKHSTPKKLTVVSSDHRIQKAAQRRKAIPIDSGVWYDRLAEFKNQDSSTTSRSESIVEKPDLEHLRDVDWASEFGLSDSPNLPDTATSTDEKDATFNPFPPGYADDLLDDLDDLTDEDQ